MDLWRGFWAAAFAGLGIWTLLRPRGVAENIFQARPPNIRFPEELIPTARLIAIVMLVFAVLTALGI